MSFLTCSPSGSALISGNDNHVAVMEVMGEFIYPEIENLPGYLKNIAFWYPLIFSINAPSGRLETLI